MSNVLSRKALCNAPAPYLPSRGKPFQTRPTVLVRLQLVCTLVYQGQALPQVPHCYYQNGRLRRTADGQIPLALFDINVDPVIACPSLTLDLVPIAVFLLHLPTASFSLSLPIVSYLTSCHLGIGIKFSSVLDLSSPPGLVFIAAGIAQHTPMT